MANDLSTKLASVMLEDDLVGKGDKAHTSYQELWALHQKRDKLFREMGRAIAYERALARAGLKCADVANAIHVNQLSATDKSEVQRRFSYLKRKLDMEDAIIGVTTTDGRRVFFDEPVVRVGLTVPPHPSTLPPREED